VLVEAVKDQKSLIDNLESEVEILKSGNNLKSEIIAPLDTGTDLFKNCRLFQNTPNPFNRDTEIKFEISDDVITSTLIVFDMQGTQIRSYNIPERGSSSIIIYGFDLDPGMYMYSLIADGKEVGTKRMILTD